MVSSPAQYIDGMPIPSRGFYVATGAFRQRNSPAAVGLGDWLEAGRSGGAPGDQPVVVSGDGVSVLIDGYLCETNATGLGPAEGGVSTIPDLYRKHGTAFPRFLRGSFSGILLDRARDRAVVFNDRRGSRALFVREGGAGDILVTSDIAAAASAPPRLTEIRACAVVEYLLRGCYFGTDTLFQGLRKLPQGSALVLRSRASEVERYWELDYRPLSEKNFDEAEAIEECDRLLEQAVRRALGVFSRPLLLLSGGMDSRILAGYITRVTGGALDTATYGFPGELQGDAAVAMAIAKRFGWNHRGFELEPGGFAAYYERAIQLADGRVDILDAPSVVSFWEALGASHDGFFIGDQSFGRKGQVVSRQEVMDAVGWFGLEKASRIKAWLAPSVRGELERATRRKLKALFDAHGSGDLQDIKDKLFFEERFGNLLNSQLEVKQRFMLASQPLFDEDVVEFVSTLPRAYRIEKRLLKKVLADRFPEFLDVDLAGPKALPDGTVIGPSEIWRHSSIVEIFYETLFVQNDPRIDDLFDMREVKQVLDALVADEPVPKIRHHFLKRLPGMWRVFPTSNAVHPTVALTRMLGLKLYLSGLRWH